MIRRSLVAVLFGAALFSPGLAGAAAPSVADCMDCHGDKTISMTLPDGKEVPLYVDLQEYGRSVHGGSGCVVCHTDAKAPHGKLRKVSCGRCHGDAARSFAGSSHGRLPAKGVANVPACHDCHGKHDVRKSSDPASMTFRLNIAATCLRCHKDGPDGKGSGRPGEEVVIAYAKSVHGKSAKAGQLGSAVCSDCHGNHAILPGDDPKSAVNRQNIPTLCGKCHPAISEEYEASVHGKGMRGGIAESPVCTDCHGEHTISRVDDLGSPVAARNIPRTCSRCHDKEGISSR
ncbi:MAG: Cytochrome b subunit of formate dehydrogenase-like protein, partial [Deltaproteobacteria bacterium]|nr:Cytochrome b subunit of formate dehydrogenase-like protein [Deltaproteobacteria bacterium]